MPNIKKPFCKDCGVEKTHENTGVQWTKAGTEHFISRCFVCDTKSSRERQWGKLSDKDLTVRLKKYRKYISDLEGYLSKR